MAKWYIPRRNEQERDEEKDKFAQQVSDPFHTNRSQDKAESMIKTPQKSVTDNSPEIEQKAEEFKNNLSMPQKPENTPKKSDIKQNANRWYVTEGRDKDGVRTKTFESEEARRHRLGDEAVDTGYDRYALAHAWEQTDKDQSLFDRYKQLKASAKQEEDRQHELRVREAEEKNRQDEKQIAGLSEEEVALLDKYNSQFTHDRPYTTEEKKIAKHYYDVDLDSEPKQSKEEVKEEFMSMTGMDEEAFDQIAHARDVQKNAQDREEQRTSLKDELDNKSTAGIIFSSGNAASVLGNTFGGVPAAAGVGQDLAKDREKIDTNRYTYNMVNQARDYREAAANELNERYGDVAGFLYQAGMSAVDSAVTMPFKGIGLAMLSTTAAANTLQDAQNRGLDRNHALATAAVAGAVEAITEKVSMDKVFDILKNKGVKSLRSYLGQWLSATFTEGSEEAAADVLNAVADLFINTDENEFRQSIRAYEEQGLSEKDAQKQVAKDFAIKVGQDAAAGAIAGGVHGGIALTGNRILTASEAKEMFNDGNYAEFADSIDDSRESYQNDGDWEAAKEAKQMASDLAKKHEAGEKIASREKTKLLDLINESTVGAQRAQETKEPSFIDKLANRFNELVDAQDRENNEPTGNAGQSADNVVQNTDNAAQENRRVAPVQSDITQEETISRMSQAKTAEELGAVYNEAKNSVHEDVRKMADNLYDTYAGKLQSEGVSPEALRQGRISEREAYEAGREGKDLGKLNAKQTEAYSRGVLERQREEYSLKAGDSHATTSDGTDIEVSRIVDTKEGKVETSDGQVLPMSEIHFGNAGTQRLYNEATEFRSPETAQIFIEAYPAGTPVNSYSKYAKRFYNAGQLGSQSFEEVLKNNEIVIKRGMSEEAARSLYEAGQNQKKGSRREESKPQKVRRAKGRVIDERANKEDKAISQIAKGVADKLGVDIRLTDQMESQINGQFSQSAAEVVLNTNNNKVWQTLFHECMGEFTEAWNETGMAEIQDEILNWWLSGSEGAERLDNVIKKYQSAYEKKEGSKSYREAANELVNDALAGLFSTPEGIEEFTKWANSNVSNNVQTNTVLERIANYIKELIDTLKDYIARHTELSDASRSMLQMEADRAAGLRARILEAADQAKANYQNAQTEEKRIDTKHSINIDKEYENAVDNELLTMIKKVEQGTTDYIPTYSIPGGVSKQFIDEFNGLGLGYSIDDYSHYIEPGRITHNDRRHGAERTDGSADSSMRDPKDLARIKYVLDNPDKMRLSKKSGQYKNSDGSKAQTIELQKKIKDNYYYVVEAVPDSNTKKMFIVSAYINKNDTFSQVSNANGPTTYAQSVAESDVSSSMPIVSSETENTTPNSRDVKHSLVVDSEGRELSEGQQEYFKDSKVLDENGNLKVVYHGTGAQFTVFDIEEARDTEDIEGFFFSEDREEASGYGEPGKYYLNITNPADYDTAYDLFFASDTSRSGTGRRTREALIEKGYDGVIAYDEDSPEYTEYIAFYPEQIKRTDNENPTEDPDIRFSLSGIDTDILSGPIKYSIGDDILDDLFNGTIEEVTFADEDPGSAESYRRNIDTTVANLSRMLEAANAPLRGHSVDYQRIGKIADRIKSEYNSHISKQVLTNNLTTVFDYLQNNENIDYDDITRLLTEIAAPVLEKTGVEVPEAYQHFKQYVRTIPIKLSEQQKQELAYTYGSYDSARKQNFGRINFSDEGTPIDRIWPELVRESAGLLDEATNAGDMAHMLIDAVENCDHGYSELEIERGQNMAEASIDLAIDIMEEYYKAEADAIRSEAVNGVLESGMAGAAARESIDKARAQMKRQQEEFRKKTKEEYDARIRALEIEAGQVDYYKAMADYNETVRKIEGQKSKAEIHRLITELANTRRDLAIKTKALQKDSVMDYKMRQDAAKTRKEITRIGNDLMKRILEPTSKKHVPTDLQKPLAEFLSSIDFVSHRSKEDSKNTKTWRERMQTLSIYLSQLEDGRIEDELGLQAILDPDLNADIRDFIKDTEGYARVSQLDAKHLKDLLGILKRLQVAINKSDTLYLNNTYKKVSDLAVATRNELEKKKTRRPMFTMQGIAYNTANISMLDPTSYFEEMGEAPKSVFKTFRNGFDQRAWHLKEAQEYMEKVLEGISQKDLAQWSRDKYTFNVSDGEITLTITQIMSLYELMKRDQAREHIMRGGIKADVREEGRWLKKSYTQNKPVHITPENFLTIIGKLTDEQKAVADAMQRFMATQCAEWGNHTTEQMYGYKKFTEKNYYPIKTDKNTIAANDKNTGDNGSLYHLRNLGMTKDLTPHAKNAIVLSDIFNVFSDHVADMATYDGMVMPLSDAMRWFNFKVTSEIMDEAAEFGSINDMWSIQEEIERVLGTPGKAYFTNLIKDINGMTPKAYDTQLADKLISNYKAAAVGANVRVIVQQPTAILRAANEMSPKYLARVLNPVTIAQSGKLAQKAKDYSAIAWWKGQGYFETSIGQSMRQMITGEATMGETIREYANKGAQVADDLTWGLIWRATELEIKDKRPELEYGSKEFYDAVTERFNEIVDKTQVVDTVLHRTQLMRSKSDINKLEMAFMAEPMKSYNMLHRAWKSGNKKTLARAATTFVLTNILTAAAAAIVDAFRKDDDETPWLERYLTALKENIIDNLNPLNMFPYLKDVSSAMQGFENGRMDIEGINNLVQSLGQLEKFVKGESKKTPYGMLKSLSKGISQLSGIPAYSLIRTFESIYNTFFDNLQTTVTSDYSYAYTAIDKNGDIEGEIQKLIDKGKNPDSIAAALTKHYKNEYAALSEEERPEMKEKLLRAYEAAGKDYEQNIDKWVKDAEKSEEAEPVESSPKNNSQDASQNEEVAPVQEEYTSDYAGVYDAIDKGGDIQAEVQSMLDSGKQKSGVKSAITRHYKDDYLAASGSEKANMKNTLIKAYTAAGYTREEAISTIEGW